jgi:hypothetical protein
MHILIHVQFGRPKKFFFLFEKRTSQSCERQERNSLLQPTTHRLAAARADCGRHLRAANRARLQLWEIAVTLMCSPRILYEASGRLLRVRMRDRIFPDAGQARNAAVVLSLSDGFGHADNMVTY